MIEYMNEVYRILVTRGRREPLSLEQQLIVEECFKRGNSASSCASILSEQHLK